MASVYHAEHRQLQETFGTTRLATMLDENWLHEAIQSDEQAFIEGRDMFFLSTVDPDGNPTVSYKGGPVGLVRVVDERTLAFPGFDGNGMFLSMGNIVGQSKVGLLFIDFETPHRVRVQGTATFHREDPLLGEWAEAKYVVRVAVSKVWVNCPRYIHRYKRVEQSRYVPVACRKTPLATWKRLDFVQEVIADEDRVAAEAEGIIGLDEYQEKAARGEA